MSNRNMLMTRNRCQWHLQVYRPIVDEETRRVPDLEGQPAASNSVTLQLVPVVAASLRSQASQVTLPALATYAPVSEFSTRKRTLSSWVILYLN